ncbi:hypothetical protein [Methylorubrum zatmanii]|uniref:Uncharacterized protein n=1 Tax=Methylorubrum zatmanii TaxID=29429 RepID=A0ABW1WV95_9HYPH|nr:hypothetical protein [Methylorubrum zatmanii]MBD8908806.1 hypothetical protein [Methylorubrum zatmanii]
MDQSETNRADAGQIAGPSRALVAGTDAGPAPRIRGRRPMAGFLTQLIVSADPTLRSPRPERTKAAAALYARAAASAKRA